MRPWPIILVLLSSLQAAACTHRHGSGAPRAASTLDSLVGIVSIAGTSFEQHIVLRSRNSTTTLEFSKSDSAALSRVGGTEVVVYGNSSADMFRVVNFEVVRVEGAPVLDGVLAQLGEKLVLEVGIVRRAPRSRSATRMTAFAFGPNSALSCRASSSS